MPRKWLSLYLFVALLAARPPLSLAHTSTPSEVLQLSGELSPNSPENDYPLNIGARSAITIEVHQKDSQLSAYGMDIVTRARLSDALGTVDAFSVESAKDFNKPWWQRLTYTVAPGQYIIHVGSNRPVTHTLTFAISVTKTELSENPAPAKALESWLRENGLEDMLTLRSYYAFASLSERQDLGTLFPYSSPEETSQALYTVRDLLKPDNRKHNSLQFMDAARHPHVFLKFRSHTNGLTFASFSRGFADEYGDTLDNKLISVAAGFSHTSRLNFVLLIQGDCWNSVHIAAAEGKGFDDAFYCTMASTATVVPSPAGIVPLEKISVSGFSGKYMDKIERFLESYFTSKNGRITILENTPRYIELVVRYLKGEIIHGGNQWERLSLAVSVTPIDQNSQEVRAIAEGFLASGFTYPPDDSFTQSMEPAHSRDLQDYARAIISQIGNALKSDGANPDYA
jgi:hypothetical protein